MITKDLKIGDLIIVKRKEDEFEFIGWVILNADGFAQIQSRRFEVKNIGFPKNMFHGFKIMRGIININDSDFEILKLIK